jgi:hypothetical protein
MLCVISCELAGCVHRNRGTPADCVLFHLFNVQSHCPEPSHELLSPEPELLFLLSMLPAKSNMSSAVLEFLNNLWLGTEWE